MTRYATATADAAIPDLDLTSEALHMAEAIAALEHAKEHFALIRGYWNRMAVTLVSIRAEKAIAEAATAALYDRQKADKLLDRYKTEALAAFLRKSLGLSPDRHLQRMDGIVAEVTQKAEERARQAQRSTEAAAYAARGASSGSHRSKATGRNKTPSPVAKVSDEALIAELKAVRHDSVSALARKVGLSVQTAHNRVWRLVQSGAISASEVPHWHPKKKGGR